MSWKHISGWVQVTEPQGPEGPVEPGWGGGRPQPPDPGYDRPGIGAGLPGNELPGIPGGVRGWRARLIQWLRQPEGPATKPPSRPVRPPSIDNGLPPNGGRPPHPWRPGHWEPIDPGFGKPPLWAFFPHVDNGLPEPPPDLSKPPGGGAWFPADPDWGMPIRPCPPVGGKPHPPIWGWVPDRPPVEPPAETAITFYPSNTVTVLASGGSGSVNISGGAWTVDPASVPAWVTINPMSGDESKNMTYAAAANTTGVPKQALIKVSGATFTINQGAA